MQVLLTRIFAAQLFYHFSFLCISLALLGAGAGAIAVYVRPAWFDRIPLEEQLARWSVGLAIAAIVVPLVIAQFRYGASGDVTKRFVLLLFATSALCTVLFAIAGVVIALAVRGYTRQISKLYAFDLAGAALGAAVVVPLMWHVKAPTLAVAIGPTAAFAAVLFAGGVSSRVGRAAVVAFTIGAAAIAVSASGTTFEPKSVELPGTTPVADRWSPLSRVVAFAYKPTAPFWALFYDRGGAPVARYRRGGTIPNWRALHLGPHSLGYVFGGRGRALIIGGGGGRDILNALSEGVRRVDVVELNSAIVKTVDDDLKAYSGAPYTLPGVHTRTGDGRARLAESDAKYDVIHLGFTDSVSGNSGQAFALTDNNLYTEEAFAEYFKHLRPNGVLDLSRPRRLIGDEALRLTVLSLESLRRRGVAHPERNVVVVLGRDILGELFGTVLVRLRPWTPAELARLRILAVQRGLGVAFAPGGPYRLEWKTLHAARSPEAFCSSYRLDVCPPTDDRPFFFQMRRFGQFGDLGPGYIYKADPFEVLLATFGILALLSAVLVALPLVLTSRRQRPPARALSFFAAIGLGFLTLEVTLIQRFELFLGFPTYALSIVLFALLLWTGAGSLLAGRASVPQRSLTVALGVACVLMAASAFGLRPLLTAMIGLPFALRVLATVAMLAPVGIPLGMAMPLGLSRLAAAHPQGVAWAWGVNGVASVVASAGAVTVALVAGFPIATLVALACYLAALLHVRVGAWPRSGEA